MREAIKHSAYLFDFERPFLQNYLNGNAALILDFHVRGDCNAELPASIRTLAPDGKASSVVLYSQAHGFDLVDCGNNDLVLVPDVQIVKMFNKPIPSLVGLKIENKKLEEVVQFGFEVNSTDATLKIFGISTYGKLGVRTSMRRSPLRYPVLETATS